MKNPGPGSYDYTDSGPGSGSYSRPTQEIRIQNKRIESILPHGRDLDPSEDAIRWQL
jgi:hypothetical protein